MSPAQCRAARALLNWSQEDLGRAANVNKMTVANSETSRFAAREDTVEAITRALLNAGITFLRGDAGEEGVWKEGT